MKKPATPAAFYAPQSYRPEDSVGLLMRKILTALSRNIEQELAQADLTNAQWVPLYKLHTGCASTAAELARESHLDAGAMTRMLDRLEAKGLCQRTRSESDRRVVNISITAAGAKAAAGIPQALSNVQNQVLGGFSAEEFALLKSFLQRMLDNAQGASDCLPFISGDSDAV